MRKDEFVMRGKTPSNEYEILNFSGFKPGYAYKLIEFQLYPSTSIGSQTHELSATLTAAKLTGSPPASPADPSNPDFSQEGLIGTAVNVRDDGQRSVYVDSVINDTFFITQNLILAVIDSHAGTPMDVNWQCKFKPVKMSGSEEAVANYKQFMISDD